jgi:Flp pilus assembly protein TadB
MGVLYTTTPGRILLAIAVSGLAIGVFLINRMARLRY